MTGPLLLIALGVLLLLNNFYPVMFSFRKLWPVILIVIGLVKVFESFRRDRNRSVQPGDEPASKEGP